MSRSGNIAVSVTWTWPVMAVMFVFAMLPIWGPLIPPLEGMLAPVTSKITFIQQSAVEGGMHVRMSYVKKRDCEILGVSMDTVNGVPIQFEPVNGSVELLQTRGTGPQISRMWFIGADKTDDLRLRFIHRCSPLWLVVTVAFP